MDAVAYADFLEKLVADLGADHRVVGVVGLGATAAVDRTPDRWSAHRLCVVVSRDEEEFCRDPSWLPESDRLVLWMRETRREVRAMYDDGHLFEATVCTLTDLPDGLDGPHRVLMDRGGVRRAVVSRAPSSGSGPTAAGRAAALAGRLVISLASGLKRHARGEVLSGRDLVKGLAVDRLLELLALVGTAEDPTALDRADPRRRAEQAFPGAVAAITDAIDAELPEAVLGLLTVAETTVARHLEDWPTAAVAVVRRMARGG